MKLEPIKHVKIPAYAAALAASAALLTGCGYDGAVVTDGTAPADPVVQYDGEVEPDALTEPLQTAVTTEEILLEGEINPYTNEADGCDTTTAVLVSDRKPDVVGSVALTPDDDDDVPVQLDGDVLFVPDFPDADAAHKQDYELLSVVYQSVFEKRGYTSVKSSRQVNWFGAPFYEGLRADDQKTQVIFYDGEAAAQDVTLREWLRDQGTEVFDWGCLLKIDDPDADYTRVVFVDLNATDDPEQILRDVGL